MMKTKAVGSVYVNKKGAKELVVLGLAHTDNRSAEVIMRDMGMEVGYHFRNGIRLQQLLYPYQEHDIVFFDVEYEGSGGYKKIHDITSALKGWEVVGKYFISVNAKVESPAGLRRQTGIPGVAAVLAAVIASAKSGKELTVTISFELEDAQKIINLVSSDEVVMKIMDDSYTVLETNDGIKVEKVAKAPKTEKKSFDPNKFYWETPVQEVFQLAARLLNGGHQKHINIMLKGPSGYGKTEAAAQFAAKMGYTFYRFDCPLISDPGEALGYVRVSEGSTYIEKSPFSRVLEAGNAVIALDELNRTYPNIMNFLLPLLDTTRAVEIQGQRIVVGPNVVFVATVNLGSQYTGTFQADAALLNRFMMVASVGNIPSNVEVDVLMAKTGVSLADGRKLVDLATKVRGSFPDAEFSIRTTLAVATAMSAGMPLRNALEFCFLSRVNDSGLLKQLIDLLQKSTGIYNASLEVDWNE